jgi:hypothetical protein
VGTTVAPGQDLQEALAEVGVSTDGDLAQALAQRDREWDENDHYPEP